ncbi:MAG: rod shape-determining protein RodA [Candidatus Magnetoovum sp. WYHC-5]|nr:rod shape-determining protein RodA [Candidatus Magnetoovum sp. WYHC-5]
MIQINRKYIKHFDWYIFLILLSISLIGVFTIYSATRPIITNVQQNYYTKQLLWICIGMVGLIAVVIYDYAWLRKSAYVFYIFGIILLLLVLLIGKKGMGAQRWIDLKIIVFQPSDLFKIVLIVALARYLSTIRYQLTKGSFAIALVLFGFLPFALIIKQPHLGTALITFSIFVFLALSKGIEKKFLIGLTIFLAIVVPLVSKTMWNGLKEYQKNRIVAFIDPAIDPKGMGYQIEQSKVTAGSGMIFGKGYLHGTQGPLRFLPEKHTDFIFSVFAEEWGFVGCTIMFILYFMLFIRGIDTALKAKDEFGRYVSIGITFMLFMYFIINIGMVLGMMPVVGVPIPFMSYGGTSTITNFLAVGILINIRMRRVVMVY